MPKEQNRRTHRSTDERAKKHQEQSDRERFEKSMQNRREHFRGEAAKTAAKPAAEQAAGRRRKRVMAVVPVNHETSLRMKNGKI